MGEKIRVPALSADQMAEVDRLMVEDFHVELSQTVEKAGHALAVLSRDLLDGDLADRPIVVLAGRGANGAGGLAAARQLLNWGAWVQVICTHPPDAYRGVPAQQMAILEAIGAPLAWAEEGWELPPADLIIDAVVGYGLRGDPRGSTRDLIQLANSSMAPILSLDTPSGVDHSAHAVHVPHVQATTTLALGFARTSLLQPAAAAAHGDLYLGDMGAPAALYARLGLDRSMLFARNPIVRLHVEDGEIWMDLD